MLPGVRSRFISTKMESRFAIEPLFNDGASASVITTSKGIKEQLLQYNLNETMQINRFRFTGQAAQSAADYQELLDTLFGSVALTSLLGFNGVASEPVSMSTEALSMSTMNMSFFDRLTEIGIVGPGGRIKGCFDDTFDGIIVSQHYASASRLNLELWLSGWRHASRDASK
jgi:hypothetical protein